MKSPPKRILFVDHTASLGGGELALLALVRQLDRSRFEPVVLLFSHGPLEVELRSIAETHVLSLATELANSRKDTVGISALPWNTLLEITRFLLRLRRTVEDLRPSLIYTNSLKADLLGGLVARYLRIPLIWHIRDRIEPDYLPSLAVRGLRLASRLIPDAVIANSRTTLLTLHLPERTDASVIPSGIHLAPFIEASAGAESLGEALAAGHEVRIGVIGRICAWKGQDVFLRAAALVHSAFPTTRFLVIGAPLFGEKEDERNLRSLCQSIGLQNKVTFTGFQRDMPAAVAGLHVLVHASTIPEPFGQVIVQGMAAAKPVVATRGGGPSEIITDGETGFLIDRGDAQAMADTIQFILTHPEIAHTAARRGQHSVRSRYDIETTTHTTERLFWKLLT